MRGRNWLVRRAERRLGPKLGRLRYVASSRRIFWKALFPWSDIAPGSLKAVTTADGSDPDRRLVARQKVSLGAGGRNALVFQARETFWVFASDDDPRPLVVAVQESLREAGMADAVRATSGALPAVVLTGRTALD